VSIRSDAVAGQPSVLRLRAPMTADDLRDRVLEALARDAYQYREDPPFQLSSGGTSPEYLDGRLALSRGDCLAAVGALVLDALGDEIDAVGGLTLGADPIAMATTIAAAGAGWPLRWFVVRKEAKEHGKKRLVEGAIAKGESVAVLEDTVTKGSSTIQAIERCREVGLRVGQVIALIDREEGGLERIRSAAGPDVPVSALFTLSEIRAAYRERGSPPT
jgi:orotate phosphoribosyltransferase